MAVCCSMPLLLHTPTYIQTLKHVCCRAFLMLPGSRDSAVHCRIHRDKSSKMYPKYQLVLENGTQFLMSARKRKKSKSSNYVLSFDQEDTARFSGNFAGKVRANFLGTEFVVFDQGQKPQKAGKFKFCLCLSVLVIIPNVSHCLQCGLRSPFTTTA